MRWVALWTSLVFGLAHSVNIFTEGIGAIPLVLTTTVAGCFFDLTPRVSSSLLVPIAFHRLRDFGLFSARIADELALIGTVFILADLRRRLLPVFSIPAVTGWPAS